MQCAGDAGQGCPSPSPGPGVGAGVGGKANFLEATTLPSSTSPGFFTSIFPGVELLLAPIGVWLFGRQCRGTSWSFPLKLPRKRKGLGAGWRQGFAHPAKPDPVENFTHPPQG